MLFCRDEEVVEVEMTFSLSPCLTLPLSLFVPLQKFMHTNKKVFPGSFLAVNAGLEVTALLLLLLYLGISSLQRWVHMIYPTKVLELSNIVHYYIEIRNGPKYARKIKTFSKYVLL